MGLIFLVAGVNGIFQFLPMPQMTEEGLNFMKALGDTGYMLSALMIVQTLCGFMLVANKFVPFALILIFPIVLNIFLFHLFLDYNGLILGTILLLTNLGLAWAHRENYECIFKK
ncbi:MAG: hypothetical protein A2X86_08325 [Bdellovibrionales bacterium GWA2_49_15]|nr:MAG: hypothetical protein A2X86_08325 [Bdellovibrionales bacterium GWA2_49_15]